MLWRYPAGEDLDDDHATAAAWTRRLAGVDCGSDGLGFRFCNGEQLPRVGYVVGTSASGEQAVVADAMEAFGEHVDEEPADKLADVERSEEHTSELQSP